MGQGHDVIETLDGEQRNDSTKIRKMQSVEILMELYESTVKKNVELQI